MPLFLSPKREAPAGALFDVPHHKDPWSAKKLERRFPHLTKELDGQHQDSCLTFFYKLNKALGIYEFIDTDAEMDFADLMGVQICSFDAEIPEDEDTPVSQALTPDQIALHKENIQMIQEGLKTLEDQKKSTK